MEVRIERLETMRVAHTHVLSKNPEEDAWKKIKTWAEPRRLLEKMSEPVYSGETRTQLTILSLMATNSFLRLNQILRQRKILQ